MDEQSEVVGHARRFIDDMIEIQRQHGHAPHLTTLEYEHAVAEVARWSEQFVALDHGGA